MKIQSKFSLFLLFALLAAAFAACSAPGSPVLDLKGTSWQVVEINGQAVSDKMEVTASFGDAGQVTGKAACNQYFADYTQDGSSLKFGPAGMTEMLCMDEALMQTQSAFGSALAAVERFEEDGKQIRLLDGEGKAVLVLDQPRPAPTLEKTSWQLTELNGQMVPVGVMITLSFAEGRATGKAACNNYFTGYTQDNDSLTFSQVGGTEMYCEGLMDYESATYEALAKVKSFTLKNDVLSLLDENGSAVLIYGAPQEAPNLSGTAWRVKMVGELQVAEGLEVTMKFEDGRISGKASCNGYGAGYTQDGSKLSFGLAESTLMYCDGEGVMDTEQAFLGGLEKVRSFQFEMGNLVLLDENGALVMLLARE